MIKKRLFAAVLALTLIPGSYTTAFADDIQDVNEAAELLIVEALSENLPLTSDIVLPLEGVNGTEISWHSSKPELLLPAGDEGLIIPGKEEETVILTATVSKNGESAEKEFEAVVAARTPIDSDVPYYNTFENEGDFSTDQSALPYWTLRTEGQGKASVESDPDANRPENNVLAIDTSASGDSIVEANLYFDAVAPTEPGQKVIIEQEIRNTGGNCHLMYMYGNATNGSLISNSYTYATRLLVQTSGSELKDAESPYTLNKWYKMRYEIDTSTQTFDYYLDDTLRASGVFRMNASDVRRILLGRQQANQMGTLYIDNQKVYADPYYYMEKASAEVKISGAESVKANINLPEEQDGISIRWISDNPDVITDEGIVTRPDFGEGDVEVFMTALLEKESYRVMRKLPVIVKERAGNAIVEDLEMAVAELEFAKFSGQPEDEVVFDFTLPSEIGNDCEIFWESSDLTALIISDGNVTVVRDRTDKTVELKAILSKEGQQMEKTFSINVSGMPEYSGEYHYLEDFAGGSYDDSKLIPTYGVEGSQIVESNGEGGYMLHISRKGGAEEPMNNFADIYFENISGKVIVESRVKHNGGSANFLYSYGDGALFSNLSFGSSVMMSTASGGETIMTGVPANVWYEFRVIMDFPRGLFDVYINDTLVAKDKKCRMAAKFLNHILSGLSQTSTGHFYIDYVKVYSDPFYNAQTAVDSIDIGRVDALEKNVTLPLLSANGYDIEWISSDPEVISHDGDVIRPPSYSENADVVLTAVVRDGDYAVARTFDATVLRHKTDKESVDCDMESLYVQNTGKVVSDLLLYTTGEHGTTISWNSDKPEIVSPDGTVVRPEYNDGKRESVVLTATVSKNAVSTIKTFELSVVEMNYALEVKPTGSSDSAAGVYRFATDEKADTYWIPSANDQKPELIVDMGSTKTVNLVTLKNVSGDIYGSLDKNVWTKLGSGSKVYFAPTEARYIKAGFARNDVSVAEIGVYMHMTDEAIAETDLAKINLGSLSGVKSDLSLPGSGENGSIFTWSSSDKNCISDSGKVTRPDSSDKKVILTVVAKKGDAVAERTFEVTVAAKSQSGGSGGSSGGSSSGGRGPGGKTSSSSGGGFLLGGANGMVNTPIDTVVVFSDLHNSAWAEQYIYYLAERKILSGTGNGRFEPQRAITRAEFTKLIVEALDILDTSASADFVDVDTSSWAYPYIASAYKLGIVNGIGEGSFGADMPVTRQDMAVITANALEKAGLVTGDTATALVFTDKSDVADYALKGVSVLCENGIVSGNPDGSFNPAGYTERAQAAKIIYQVLMMKEG